MRIIKEKKFNFPNVQKFYTTVQYYSKIQPDDVVFSCYENDQIIGVVRLAPEKEVFVLRGMMIAPSHQRKGIGSLMLKELEKEIIAQDCFCIPHDWLESFYGQIGFKKIEDSSAPSHLRDRITAYKKDYPQLIMMKRTSK